MNRRERKASGIKGKKGDAVITAEAVQIARDLTKRRLYDEARNLYLKILKYDPENEAALLDLGVAAVHDNNFEEAEALIRKTLRVNPKQCASMVVLAEINMAQFNMDEALRLMEKALMLNPSPQALNRLGVMFSDAGQLERGRQYLETAIARKPDYIEAYYHLKPRKKFSETEIQQLGKIESQRRISLEEKIWLEFTLGNAYFDVGDADKAFQHLGEGNMLKRATYNYDVDTFARYIDNIIALFNKDIVEKLRRTQNISGPCPIFIVGLPRTGSTLADQIISSHPSVGSLGETKNFEKCIPLFPNAELPGFFGPRIPSITKKLIDCLTPDVLNIMSSRYFSFAHPSVKDCPYFIDKMPFNYLSVGLLRLAFPNCKIIHSVRDPIDTGFSIWKLLFTDDMMWAYDMRDIGRYTVAYQKLMAHWQKLFPGEIYDLNYEALVGDQEAETRKLLEFCGLTWDENCLNFHETERRVSTASATQVRQPIYKDSVKKWKKYEKYLQPMIEALAP